MENEELFKKYAIEGENMDALEALHKLIKAYMKECGKSIGMRTVVYTAAEMWLYERLPKQSNNPFTDEQIELPLGELMPQILKEYDPDYYDKWDIGWGFSDEEFKDMCLIAIDEKRYDESTLQALCWGIKMKPDLCQKWMDEDWKRTLTATDES